ncbi:YqjD family protein [Aestuariibius sp. 2305UL40-4]|uniref:DUF883 family protein n=1 Tax=Aestuariibius violaceus TaxID=3234132 RepID=UPI00345EFC68
MAQQMTATPIKTKETTLDDLASQIETLKKDLADLGSVMNDYGKARGREAKRAVKTKARDLEEEGRRLALQAEDSFNELSDEATRQVRENPGMALGIAVGFGFLVGMLARRR